MDMYSAWDSLRPRKEQLLQDWEQNGDTKGCASLRNFGVLSNQNKETLLIAYHLAKKPKRPHRVVRMTMP